MSRKLMIILIALIISTGFFIAGCETQARTGALIGTGVGALAGQAIGGNTRSTVIGGAIGAGAGYIIGNETDKDKK